MLWLADSLSPSPTPFNPPSCNNVGTSPNIRARIRLRPQPRAAMRKFFRLLLCIAAVACIQTFKGYGVVHDRVELDSLDRKIAQLKEGERRVLSGSGRTMLSGGRRGDVWEMPESNPRLDSEAHVHTGEEAVRWEDRGIKVGEKNDAHIIRAGRGPAPGPRGAPTAHPDGEAHTKGKLDKLGVNTGSEHLKWDDGLGSTEGMEDSYSFGSTPVREDTSPLASVGLLASVGSAVVPKSYGGDAHSFFRANLRPVPGGAVHHGTASAAGASKAAQGLLKEADEAGKRALAARMRFARDEHAAAGAERQAAEVRKLALGVGEAKLAAARADERVKASEAAFRAGLASENRQLAMLSAPIHHAAAKTAPAIGGRGSKPSRAEVPVGRKMVVADPQVATLHDKSDAPAKRKSWACNLDILGINPSCD